MPYSEGIFEDLNKALYAQFFWNQSTSAGSIVDEYIAYEFSPDAVLPVRKAIHILEPDYPRNVKNLRSPNAPVRFVLAHSVGAREALDLIERVNASVAPQIRHSWRWRIFYLRSFIDTQLVRDKFAISEQVESALDELTKIYYADRAAFVVAPPTQKAIERFRREGGGASGPPGPPPNHMSK